MTSRSLTVALAILAGCQGSLGGAGGTDAGGPGSDGSAPVDAAPVPGLFGEYFARYGAPALARVDPTIDFAWGDQPPAPEVGADRFSVRWTGFVAPPASGRYTFATVADDGVRLHVGEELVIDDWRFHFPERHEGSAQLEAGALVPLTLEYCEADLTAEVRLLWSGPGIAEEVVPAERLLTLAAPSGAPAPKPPFRNPVLPFDCPDPGVLDADPGYFMVCTGGRFRVRRSDDLVLWDDTEAFLLPDGKPPWAANGARNWAPEIHRVGARYVAYYTAVNGADVLSIGAASADDPLGPWQDRGGPLVEHPQGVIDATFFEDTDGRRWLFYKIDGNAHGLPTPIYARELAADGLSFAAGSSEVEVLRNDPGTWEGGVVEAPWVVRRDGAYYLFYSGNVYDHRYRTGVARASAITGPYEKRGAPILQNNERWVGPGHGSVVTAGAFDYLVYHAWPNDGAGAHDAAAGRHTLVDRVVWEGGWPRLHDGTPSRTDQPWPGEER